MIMIYVYLLAIVFANLSDAILGPSMSVVNAFLLIGFDFSCRDYLQSKWEGNNLWIRVFSLILAGGIISYLVNIHAAPIAIASAISFTVASSIDAGVFALLGKRVSKIIRWNGTNLVGAGIDSILFPTLAFGSFMPLVSFGQYVAKIFGGFLWSIVLIRFLGVKNDLPIRKNYP